MIYNIDNGAPGNGFWCFKVLMRWFREGGFFDDKQLDDFGCRGIRPKVCSPTDRDPRHLKPRQVIALVDFSTRDTSATFVLLFPHSCSICPQRLSLGGHTVMEEILDLASATRRQQRRRGRGVQ